MKNKKFNIIFFMHHLPPLFFYFHFVSEKLFSGEKHLYASIFLPLFIIILLVYLLYVLWSYLILSYLIKERQLWRKAKERHPFGAYVWAFLASGGYLFASTMMMTISFIFVLGLFSSILS